MKKLHARKGGFTLIELMIVVAIIGILAAIAIPNFIRFQLKAKSSEGKTNLAAIRTSEQSYYSEFGRYVSAMVAPPGYTPTSSKTSFTATTGFNTIGWAPEGQVYFTYAVGADANGTGFFATAEADIDANTTMQYWGYHKPVAGGAAAPVQTGHTCAVATLQSLAGDAQVGPCAANFGQSEF